MKKYIGLVIMLVICIVLDATLFTGIGSNIAEHNKEFLWQSFSGSVIDWICIVIVNLLWVIVAIMQIKEVELYTKSTTPWVVSFLGISVVALLLIRFF